MQSTNRPQGWLCQPCILLDKQAQRARRAEALGLRFRPGRVGLHPILHAEGIAEGAWRRIEEQNARDAWRWWLDHASAWWLEARDNLLYADRPWSRPGLSGGERWRLRYAADPEFNLRQKLRIWNRKLFRGRVDEQLRSALKKDRPAQELAAFLGYSIPELRRHLERQFTRGMAWARFCAGDIHIDHIRPLAIYDLSDPDELRAAWALSNLRPLWAKRNIEKGASLELLL